jgi:hypothetical protein
VEVWVAGVHKFKLQPNHIVPFLKIIFYGYLLS